MATRPRWVPLCTPLVTTARTISPVRKPCDRLGPLGLPRGKPCFSTWHSWRHCLPVAVISNGRMVCQFRRSSGVLARRVRTVRLSILLHQVSLNSPQNRTYKFPSIRLARFPCACAFSPLIFLHVTHRGIQHKAPLFCVGVGSSGVPNCFSLSGRPICVHDGLPLCLFGFRTIHISVLGGVFPVPFGFGT